MSLISNNLEEEKSLILVGDTDNGPEHSLLYWLSLALATGMNLAHKATAADTGGPGVGVGVG